METRRIPLFPLNVVLFPGMSLPLHIFEPRYQQMIGLCLEQDRLFGVCLIHSGEEVGGPADPYPVGTTCEILSATALEGGRMNLMTMGRERFRVRRVFHDAPYLEAEVELLPEEEPGDLGDLPERVHRAALRYITALLALQGERTPDLQLPEDPMLLSYLVGAVLQSPPPVRQELLEASVTAKRLERQLQLLEEELERLGPLQEREKRIVRPFRVDPKDVSLN